MKIIHKKARELSQNIWDQIRILNQKIIPSSLYDQNLYNGGCPQGTCDNAISQATSIETTDLLLGLMGEQLISYMTFYCVENPHSLQSRLDTYHHLGRVGYADLLVVDPAFQKNGYAKQMMTRMRQIGKEAKVDAFMGFVRTMPVPNLASFRLLRHVGAVSGRKFLSINLKIENFDGHIQYICLEMLYSSDERKLTTDRFGSISWA